MNTLSVAISKLGSRAKLARKLCVSPEAVRKWEFTRVPAERCYAIQAATGGAVTVHDLRPDVFGPAPGVPPVLPPPAQAEDRAA